MPEVLVNRLGVLRLPRKSVVRLTDRPDMTLDVYRGRNTTTKHSPQTKTFQTTVKQTCTQTMSLDMTSPGTPNNKHPQSVSHPKLCPSTRTIFLHYLYFLDKVFTQTGKDLINIQYDLHYELLLMSVPRGWRWGGG